MRACGLNIYFRDVKDTVLTLDLISTIIPRPGTPMSAAVAATCSHAFWQRRQ